uniref:Uncharacterized protein n=1 Tax=Physcomitrium patens TaxID=3218 RepID=A0A2K1IJL4_PHYPA|nr:hypothetical protein PHYPA_028162 [Physcomitrium patens]
MGFLEVIPDLASFSYPNEVSAEPLYVVRRENQLVIHQVCPFPGCRTPQPALCFLMILSRIDFDPLEGLV